MTVVTRKLTPAIGLGLTDVAAFLLIYFLPTLSHLAPIPLYLLDPMRIAVLGALICTRNWKNSLVLALTLPVFSWLIGSHPFFPKCLLIAVELCANVAFFVLLSRKIRNAGLAAFVSIVASKALYYILKYACISAGFIAGGLVSTGLWMQAVVSLLLSVGIWLSFRKA